MCVSMPQCIGTQVQAHSAVQPAGGTAASCHAVCAPGDRDLQRQVAGG